MVLERMRSVIRRCGLAAALLLLLECGLAGAQDSAIWGVTAVRKVLDGVTVAAVFGASGDFYLAGSEADFQSQPPAPTKSFGDTSRYVSYIWRLDAAGRTVFVTALGGTYTVRIAVASDGDVVVSGAAPGAGFYTTPGAYRSSAPPSPQPNADYSQFACRLRASDGEPRYCTYLDSPGSAGMVEVDAQGNAIVVSGPASPVAATPGAINIPGGNINVVKLDAAGAKLIFAASFPGIGGGAPNAATLDAGGNIYIVGELSSELAKLSADGTAVSYARTGRADEHPAAIAIDSMNRPRIVYKNESGALGVRAYSPDLSSILFDTRLGLAMTFTSGIVMAADADGGTIVLGSTSAINLPTVHPSQTCRSTDGIAGLGSGFMARLTAAGTLHQLTYLEGSGNPFFRDIAVTADSAQIAVWSLTELTVKYAKSQLEVLRVQSAPETPIACLGNAASLTAGPLVPGEIISIFGHGLGPAEPAIGAVDAGGHYPVSLSGTLVTFDGKATPLLYAGNDQINTVAPFALTGKTRVCVASPGKPESCVNASVAAATPGVFTWPVTPGTDYAYAMALNQDGSLNSAGNPALRGSIISLFCTGLGRLNPNPEDGRLAGLPVARQDLTVQTESANPDRHAPYPLLVTAEWAGQAPFQVAGLSQVNVRVPPWGNSLNLRLIDSGTTVARSNTVLIWIR
jgi:uncharacterized protein (TIGR03437 family)